jgi:hypothetical protein
MDQDIAKWDKYKMEQKGWKHFFHEALKSGWCISKTKMHHWELVMAFGCAGSSFMNTYFYHYNLVIT